MGDPDGESISLGKRYGEPLGEEYDDPIGDLSSVDILGNSNKCLISSLVVVALLSSGGGHVVYNCMFNISPLIC